MSESDIEQKIGRENLERMERLGIQFLQNEPRNAEAYEYVGVSSRGTPVWIHTRSRECDLKITIGQAQSNHWGAGGGGKLILPRRRLRRDDRVEPLRLRPLAADALRRLCRPDALGHRRGGDDVRPPVHDERAPRHARPRDRRASSARTRRRIAHAIERFNSIYTYEHPGEQADIAICGVFAPTDHLFFHTGWGCMSADFVLRDGGTIIYASPSPGVSTAVGDFPGLALMDLMKPYMPPTPENYQRVLRDIHAREIQMWAGCIWVPIYEVMTRKHLKLVTLEENLELAADIGMDATTSLDEAFAEAMERHGTRREGAGAAVRALPASAQHRAHGRGAAALPAGGALALTQLSVRGVGAARGADAAARPPDEIRGSTTIVELLRMFPGGEAGSLLATLALPCAHCGGAFHEPLTLAAKRHKRDPRAVLEAFRALAAADRPPSRLRRPAAAQRDPLPRRRRPDARRHRRGQRAPRTDRCRRGRLGAECGLLRGEARSRSRGRGPSR